MQVDRGRRWRQFRAGGGTWFEGSEPVALFGVKHVRTSRVRFCPDAPGQLLVTNDHIAWTQNETSEGPGRIFGFVSLLQVRYLRRSGRRLALCHRPGDPRHEPPVHGFLASLPVRDDVEVLTVSLRTNLQARRLERTLERQRELARASWPALALDPLSEDEGGEIVDGYLSEPLHPPGPAEVGTALTGANILPTVLTRFPERVTTGWLDEHLGQTWRRDPPLYAVLSSVVIGQLLAPFAAAKDPDDELCRELFELIESILISPDDQLLSAGGLELSERLTQEEIDFCDARGGPQLRRLLAR